jgi:hypothetical protein
MRVDQGFYVGWLNNAFVVGLPVIEIYYNSMHIMTSAHIV